MNFSAIDELLVELKGRRPLNQTELQRLRDEFIIEHTYDSNAIEGSTLTLRETALILQEGITIAEKPIKEHLEAIGYKDAFEYGNFGVLFNTDTMQVLKMAPVFDNNRSLFPELDDEQLAKPEWYIQKCRPRLGKDFIVTARGLITAEIKQDLRNMAGFHFQPHSDIAISKERIGALSQIVNHQIQAIVE